MDLSPAIQAELRALAQRGATVVELIGVIRRRHGATEPGEGRLLVAAYLTETFRIPLERAVEIGGWVGFEDGDGATTDEELETLLGGALRRG